MQASGRWDIQLHAGQGHVNVSTGLDSTGAAILKPYYAWLEYDPVRYPERQPHRALRRLEGPRRGRPGPGPGAAHRAHPRLHAGRLRRPVRRLRPVPHERLADPGRAEELLREPFPRLLRAAGGRPGLLDAGQRATPLHDREHDDRDRRVRLARRARVKPRDDFRPARGERLSPRKPASHTPKSGRRSARASTPIKGEITRSREQRVLQSTEDAAGRSVALPEIGTVPEIG